MADQGASPGKPSPPAVSPRAAGPEDQPALEIEVDADVYESRSRIMGALCAEGRVLSLVRMIRPTGIRCEQLGPMSLLDLFSRTYDRLHSSTYTSSLAESVMNYPVGTAATTTPIGQGVSRYASALASPVRRSKDVLGYSRPNYEARVHIFT